MKLRTSYGLIAVIVVLAIVIIAVALTSTTKVKAYNHYPALSKYALEGFSTTTNKNEGQNRVRYADISGEPTNTEFPHLINDQSASKDAQRVGGLPGGLYGNPNDNEKITTYADAKGSLCNDCARTSSGMSNSMGYLCLDREQLNLLTTRGGNQTCTTCVQR